MFIEMDSLMFRGWELVGIGILCVVFCILYTTYLSYAGWGDVLVLVFFGLVPVCGTYYLLLHSLNIDVFIIAIGCGLAINTLLIVNNYRDRAQDAISGKRTVIVRFGEKFGQLFYLFCGIIAGLLPVALLFSANPYHISIVCACTIYIGMHILTWRKMVEINEGKKLNSILGRNSLNMLFYGVALSLTIIASA